MMTSRPGRSSSIPIPRSASASASARNIESLIPIPLVSPGRQGLPGRPTAEPRRVGPEGPRPAATTSHNISISPVRSTARSVSLVSSVPGRTPSRQPFEPRVIRSSATDHSHTEECPPGQQPSTSPSQVRRVSVGSVRASGAQPTIVPQHVVSPSTVAFVRPAYLNHSSLRNFLQTDPQSLIIPSRVVEPPSTVSSRAQSYLSSVSSDNDDDSSMGSLSLPSRSKRLAAVSLPQDRILKLPTRWSEQERHPNLNVFSDGRELSYQGWSCQSRMKLKSEVYQVRLVLGTKMALLPEVTIKFHQHVESTTMR